MNPVFRGLCIYLFILFLFRLMGKKSLAEATTFDFVLLLIISEVTQQALVGQDFSLTGSFILITTLVSIDLIFSLLKEHFPLLGKATEGLPLVIVNEGKPLTKRMKKSKVSEDDILESARAACGLERMEQIKYAILEKSGEITIVPFNRS